MPFYKHNFGNKDFFKMAELLGDIKGKFLISLNDERFIRDTFSKFNIQIVNTKSAQITHLKIKMRKNCLSQTFNGGGKYGMERTKN